MNKIALFISELLEPMVVLTVTVLLGAAGSMRADRFIFFATIILLWMVLPAIVLRYIALKVHIVNDWDITDRRKRIKPLFALIILSIFNIVVVNIIGNGRITWLFIVFFVWILGFFVITLRYKLSGHLGALTLSILFLIRWYGLSLWPIIFLIPLLAWSRWLLKRHTIGQIFVGILYSLCIFLLLNLKS